MNVVVIGAGTMGLGIAHVSALAGFATTLIDLSSAQLANAENMIDENLQKGVVRQKLTAQEKESTIARLTFSSSWDAVAHAEIAIEAVPERMELKKSVFSKFSEICPANALLGSNTSSLSISEIAAATARPENVVGLHFFNPVHIMKLLEIVKGHKTHEAAMQRAKDFGEKIGKTCIVVKDAPGFATSRLGVWLGLEAMRMVEQGVASAADIDTAMKLGYGHPMGPLELTDLIGLDVRLHIAESLVQ